MLPFTEGDLAGLILGGLGGQGWMLGLKGPWLTIRSRGQQTISVKGHILNSLIFMDQEAKFIIGGVPRWLSH